MKTPQTRFFSLPGTLQASEVWLSTLHTDASAVQSTASWLALENLHP